MRPHKTGPKSYTLRLRFVSSCKTVFFVWPSLVENYMVKISHGNAGMQILSFEVERWMNKQISSLSWLIFRYFSPKIKSKYARCFWPVSIENFVFSEIYEKKERKKKEILKLRGG